MEGKSGPVKGILAEQVGAKPLDGGSGSWLSHCQPLGLWTIHFPSLGFSFSVGERVRIIL